MQLVVLVLIMSTRFSLIFRGGAFHALALLILCNFVLTFYSGGGYLQSIVALYCVVVVVLFLLLLFPQQVCVNDVETDEEREVPYIRLKLR